MDYAQSIIDSGEELVFIMDVPYVPAQNAPIALVQAAAPGAGSATLQPDYILNVCKETELTLDPESALRGVNPIGWLATNLENRDGRYIDPAKLATMKLTMLEDTKHGKLVPKTAGNGQLYYMYEATPDYVGKDRAVFAIEFEGKRYKVVADLRVVETVNENSPICGRPQLIKVKKSVSDSSDYYRLNSFSVTFGALNSGAVGQTIGSSITLDTTAAGHGWYVDPTPLDNSDDYLPTSNPDVWQAKAGSDAAGKMDLLSVLLHEYGHALGLEHSADSGDFMAATLQDR